jgi:hypothetical protein
MIGASSVDQKSFAFQPFDDGAAVHNDTRHSGMRGLGGPGAHETAVIGIADRAILSTFVDFGVKRE